VNRWLKKSTYPKEVFRGQKNLLYPIFIPYELKTGRYSVEVGIVDRHTGQAKVHLAIAGRTTDGWYPMGKVDVL